MHTHTPVKSSICHCYLWWVRWLCYCNFTQIIHCYIYYIIYFIIIHLLHCFSTDCPHKVSNNSLQWRHNGLNSVSNHQPHDCLLKHLLRHRSKKTSKLCITGLCAGYSPETGEFPAQRASNVENVSIWWRDHVANWSIEFSWHSEVDCHSSIISSNPWHYQQWVSRE